MNSPMYRLLLRQGASEPEAKEAVESLLLETSRLAMRDHLDYLRAQIVNIEAELRKIQAMEATMTGPAISSPPPKEDIQKIHAEINQIVNQRFLVMTAAITVFGVAFSLMIPHDPSHVREGMRLLRVEEIVLLLVLFMLFCIGMILRKSLRVFTSYLIAKNASPWESDWAKLRAHGVRLYTRAYSYMFLLLGFLTALMPPVVAWNFGVLSKGQFGMFLGISAGLAYIAIIWGFGVMDWLETREELVGKWRRVL